MEDKNNSLDFNIELGDLKLPQSTRESSVAGEEAKQPSFMPKFLKNASNPWFCVLHLSLKVAAIVVYLCMNFLTDKRTLSFIIVVIFTAFDFWITKNITGR